MALPMFVALGLLVYVPLLIVFGTAFTDMNLLTPGPAAFAGLRNFGNLIADTRLHRSIGTTLVTMFAPVLLQLVAGLSLALLLYRLRRVGKTVRVILLIPMYLTPVVVGLTWRMLLLPRVGGINHLLSLVGIPGLHWLGQPFTAVMSLVITTSWQWMPFVMIYLLAGLESLPTEPFEAARIDGANAWQTLRLITLPLLLPVIVLVAALRLIESLKIFPLIFVMTDGGPGTATETIYYYAYKQGFHYLNLSYSSAISLVTFVLTAFSAWFLIRLQVKSEGVE